MAIAPPDWNHYRSFLSVLRHSSLSAAARALRLTQPTIGRHIAELEASLGNVLFLRSRHGLTPTPAAMALLPHAETMAAAADAAMRATSGAPSEPSGTVRLTASEIVGVEVLPPILTTFRASHPTIAIELSLSNLNQDLTRHDADIAIRMAVPTQNTLVARKLGNVAVGLYAHRKYLERHGTPRTLGDLTRHTMISFDADAGGIRALRQTGFSITRELFAFRSDSDHAQLAHLRAGFGIGGCQKGIAARDPQLVAVLAKEFGFALPMWLVTHPDLRASRRVRLLFDHLAQGLKAYANGPGSKAVGRGGQQGGDVLYPPTLRRREPKRKRR